MIWIRRPFVSLFSHLAISTLRNARRIGVRILVVEVREDAKRELNAIGDPSIAKIYCALAIRHSFTCTKNLAPEMPGLCYASQYHTAIYVLRLERTNIKVRSRGMSSL